MLSLHLPMHKSWTLWGKQRKCILHTNFLKIAKKILHENIHSSLKYLPTHMSWTLFENHHNACIREEIAQKCFRRVGGLGALAAPSGVKKNGPVNELLGGIPPIVGRISCLMHVSQILFWTIARKNVHENIYNSLHLPMHMSWILWVKNTTMHVCSTYNILDKSKEYTQIIMNVDIYWKQTATRQAKIGSGSSMWNNA